MERPENKENWGSGQHRSQADGPSQEGGRSAVSAATEGSGRIGSKWNRWPCREGHRRCQLSDEEHWVYARHCAVSHVQYRVNSQKHYPPFYRLGKWGSGKFITSSAKVTELGLRYLPSDSSLLSSPSFHKICFCPCVGRGGQSTVGWVEARHERRGRAEGRWGRRGWGLSRWDGWFALNGRGFSPSKWWQGLKEQASAEARCERWRGGVCGEGAALGRRAPPPWWLSRDNWIHRFSVRTLWRFSSDPLLTPCSPTASSTTSFSIWDIWLTLITPLSPQRGSLLWASKSTGHGPVLRHCQVCASRTCPSTCQCDFMLS